MPVKEVLFGCKAYCKMPVLLNLLNISHAYWSNASKNIAPKLTILTHYASYMIDHACMDKS